MPLPCPPQGWKHWPGLAVPSVRDTGCPGCTADVRGQKYSLEGNISTDIISTDRTTSFFGMFSIF